MFNKDLYNLSQQVQGAIFQGAFTQFQQSMTDDERAKQAPPHALLQLRRGYAESPAWLLVQMFEFDPEALTVEKFRIRAVYSAPDLILGMFELMASEGWLERTGNSYRLTEDGRAIWQGMVQRRHAMMTAYQHTTGNDLEHLTSLMNRIVDASLGHPDVPSTWCLGYSRRRAMWYDSCPADRVIQLCGDFNAFRDDAHMSAYAPYNISGQVWEAFSFIGDGQANTAQTLYTQLAYRGFPCEAWQGALDQLVARGWLEMDTTETHYQLTDRGTAVRQQVESMTDHYFYLPWSCLSETEVRDTERLMKAVLERS